MSEDIKIRIGLDGADQVASSANQAASSLGKLADAGNNVSARWREAAAGYDESSRAITSETSQPTTGNASQSQTCIIVQ